MKTKQIIDLIIYKKFKEDGIENICILQDFIFYTEEKGYYKKGTAIQTLLKAKTIETPYSIFYIKNKTI